jgi:hypothetical protein
VKGGVLHVSVEEAARDLGRVLSHVEGGGMAVIERGSRAIAFVSSAAPSPRRIEECLAIARQLPGTAVDPGFAKDVEEGVRAHADEALRGWE